MPAGFILAPELFVAADRDDRAPKQFAAWGWRLPFLLSIVLVGGRAGGAAVAGRRPIESAAERAGAQQPADRRRVPGGRPASSCSPRWSFVANTAIGYIFLAYLLAFRPGRAQAEPARLSMLIVVIVGSVVWLVWIMGGSAWGERNERQPGLPGREGDAGGVGVPVLPAARHGGVPALIVLSVVVLTIGLGLSSGQQKEFFAELFEPRYRYSGASFAYAVGAIVGGGFARSSPPPCRPRPGPRGP